MSSRASLPRSPTSSRYARSSPLSGIEDGFTILESLLVLAILALCTMLAISNVLHPSETGQARVATQTLYDDLRWLRQQAVLQQREATLLTDASGRHYIRGIDAIERSLPDGIAIHIRPADRSNFVASAAITFFPDGGSSGGEVRITSPTSYGIVDISWPFGHIRKFEVRK